jgi:hypothetical protein
MANEERKKPRMRQIAFLVVGSDISKADLADEEQGHALPSRSKRAGRQIRRSAELGAPKWQGRLIIRAPAVNVRIPTKPAMHSKLKPATRSDLKPAIVPI